MRPARCAGHPYASATPVIRAAAACWKVGRVQSAPTPGLLRAALVGSLRVPSRHGAAAEVSACLHAAGSAILPMPEGGGYERGVKGKGLRRAARRPRPLTPLPYPRKGRQGEDVVRGRMPNPAI